MKTTAIFSMNDKVVNQIKTLEYSINEHFQSFDKALENENNYMLQTIQKFVELQEEKQVYLPFNLNLNSFEYNPFLDMTFSIATLENDKEVFERVYGIDFNVTPRGMCVSVKLGDDFVDIHYIHSYALHEILRQACYILTTHQTHLSKYCNAIKVQFFKDDNGKVIAIFPDIDEGRGCKRSFIAGKDFSPCNPNMYTTIATKDEYMYTYKLLKDVFGNLRVMNDKLNIVTY